MFIFALDVFSLKCVTKLSFCAQNAIASVMIEFRGNFDDGYMKQKKQPLKQRREREGGLWRGTYRRGSAVSR